MAELGSGLTPSLNHLLHQSHVSQPTTTRFYSSSNWMKTDRSGYSAITREALHFPCVNDVQQLPYDNKTGKCTGRDFEERCILVRALCQQSLFKIGGIRDTPFQSEQIF